MSNWREEGGWQSVPAGRLDWDWEDYTCGFKCKACGRDIILSESSDSAICDCGIEYMLEAEVVQRPRRMWEGTT